MVPRLDRLARSTRDLLEIAEHLKDAGAGLRSLNEPWADTTTPAGRMILTVFAGIAEFERAVIHQRTSSGRVAAKQRRVRFGRPPKLVADQVALARRLMEEGTPARSIAKMLKVHASTLYRAWRGSDFRRDGPPVTWHGLDPYETKHHLGIPIRHDVLKPLDTRESAYVETIRELIRRDGISHHNAARLCL